MNRETYIRKVKKQLDCSVKEKEEIVRDLQEIFDSGKEHGKSESQIIKQLGKPQAYAQALGCGRQTMPLSGKRKVAVVFLAVGGLFCLYALGESLRFRMPKNAIGGGDAMTMIHEVAHAMLHDSDQMKQRGEEKDQLTKETEAESIAFTVCSALGIDTSD